MRSSKTFYFFFFGAASCLLPFLTLHYQDLGLNGRQIGLLTGIVPLITMISASVWGAVADATHKHRLILLLAIVGTWTAVFGMSRAVTFVALIPLVSVYAFFVAPAIPLVDNSVMALLGTRKSEYGRVRVWGAYGWGSVGAIVGVLIQRSGLGWAFTGYLILMTALFLVAIRLRIVSTSLGGTFSSGLRVLMTNTQWVIFIAVALTVGMSLGIFLNYLFLYLEELGTSSTIMGLSLAVATISEIPVFLYSKKLLDRWGAKALLASAIFFTVVRAFAYVLMTAPWQVLPISLLHGPTFAAMWAAGVAYADESAPPGLGATAQGIFSGVVLGLGVALGAFVGGFLYEAYGALVVFQFAGWAALMALIIFLWVNRRSVKRPFRPASTD